MTLLVGGSNDGERVPEANLSGLQIIKKDQMEPAMPWTEEPSIHRIAYQTEYYRCTKIRGQKKTFLLYAAQGLTDDDTVKMLIENYRTPANSDVKRTLDIHKNDPDAIIVPIKLGDLRQLAGL